MSKKCLIMKIMANENNINDILQTFRELLLSSIGNALMITGYRSY